MSGLSVNAHRWGGNRGGICVSPKTMYLFMYVKERTRVCGMSRKSNGKARATFERDYK